MNMNPTEPSAHVARWIETYDVEHNLMELSLDKIDERASLHNQARRQPLDQDVVAVYAEAMKAGAVFPPLVGWEGSNGVVLCDGNHRFAAAKHAGASDIYVYVLQTDDDRIKLAMVASANPILNGYGADEEDKYRHGIMLVGQGLSVPVAARQLALPKHGLRRRVLHEKVCIVAGRFGLERIAAKTNLMYTEILSSVVEELDATTLRLLFATAGMSVKRDEYKVLVRSLDGLNDEEKANAVAGFNERHRKAINKPSSQTGTHLPWRHFSMHTAALIKLQPEAVVASVPGDRRDDIHQMADDLRGLASRIERALRS